MAKLTVDQMEGADRRRLGGDGAVRRGGSVTSRLTAKSLEACGKSHAQRLTAALKSRWLNGGKSTREEPMEEIGPVDYAIVAFPGNKFRGEIAPALADLVEREVIRIIDIAFIGKSEEGDVVAMELTELDPDVQQALESAGIEVQGLLNDEDLQSAAEGLEPNSSAAVLVWENVWARKVTNAMRDAGGVLVAFERLPHEVVQAAREWALEQVKA
jgi:uncharacterized membrane protein